MVMHRLVDATRRGVRIAGCLAALLASAPAPAVAIDGRPNIVFLLTDDQRWDTLGAAGNAIIQTPNLDQLAAEGVLFENNFVTTPVCYASRASLYTGQFNRRHRVDSFDEFLSPAAFSQTYPALLRQAGYHTGFVGKWGLGGEMPVDAFDDWQGFAGQGNYFEPGDPEHLTHRQGRQAVDFIASAPEPFLLTVAFKAPHVQDGGCSCTLPIDPVDAELYADVSIPSPPTATDAAFAAQPWFLQESEGRTRWFLQFATPEMAQATFKDYYRLITGMDRAVGAVLTALAERGVRERTVIVFTSDNGLLLGEHGLTGKWLMYEESIRAPLIVAWPGLAKARQGARVTEMTLNVDVAPTLVESAGLTVPGGMQGESLLPLIFGKPVAWRRDWFFEHHLAWNGIPGSEGVREGGWKYVRYTDQSPAYEQLFDLAKDPSELRDLLHGGPGPTGGVRPPPYRPVLDRLRARWRLLRLLLE